MDYRELFQAVRKRPKMYGLDDSYSSAVAFIIGCDAGNSWSLLVGFKEWLVTRLQDGNNLSWQGLVLRVAFLESPKNRVTNLSDTSQNSIAVAKLFDLLDEFLAAREQLNGTAVIFEQYLSWLKAQDWFSSDMLKS